MKVLQSTPFDGNSLLQSHPAQHWPNIVMILSDQADKLAQDRFSLRIIEMYKAGIEDRKYVTACSRLVYLYDYGIEITFFLQMIEPRFTLGTSE